MLFSKLNISKIAPPLILYLSLTKSRARGTLESINFYQNYTECCRAKLLRRLSSETFTGAVDDANEAEQLLQLATQPTDIPHHYTIDETRALRYLCETKCAYTPHLLQVTAEVGAEWVDEKAMGDGYVVFILMTKVPGERMDYDMFWSKVEGKREEIRRAFKTALL
jgi:hypothetical protein